MDVRKSLALSRRVFARMVVVTPKNLSNYELAMAKVSARLGGAVCREFGISERWLATGAGARESSYTLPADLVPSVSDHIPFTQAYQWYLKVAFEQRMVDLERLAEIGNANPGANEVSFSDDSWSAFPVSIDLLSQLAERIPKHLQWRIYERVSLLMREMDRDFFREIDEHSKWKKRTKGLAGRPPWRVEIRRAEKPWEKKKFDGVTVLDNKSPVPLTLKQILNRALVVTRERGMKRKLADFLDVAPPRLSLWLHGKQEPGAEAALRMLAWVTAEEAKQNQSAADAETSATQKTRGKQKHENQTGRKKQ